MTTEVARAPAGFQRVTLQNQLLTVTVCPEACRILSLENRKAKTGYLRRLESQLPDNARAGGIGDAHYAPNWRAGKWEYMERDERLAGYAHELGTDSVRMTKEALHDHWKDANAPGLKVERTVRLRQSSVEIVDRRTNFDSSRHGMIYDLLFCLVPSGGGQVENSVHLPPWSRVQVLFANGKSEVFGREDFDGCERRLDNASAVLLTEPEIEEGVLVEFDRATQIELRTAVGGLWEANLFLQVRSPVILQRYEVLERRFTITPYSLARDRIAKLFPAKIKSKATPLLKRQLRETLKAALSSCAEPVTRGVLRGLARLGNRYLETGGCCNERFALGCVKELQHLTAKLVRGEEVHHSFFDDQFLNDKKQLLKSFPYERDADALKQEAARLAHLSEAELNHRCGPEKLAALAVEAICHDDTPTLKRIGRLYKEFFFYSRAFRQGEFGPQTIDNATGCIPLLLLNEALARAGVFSESDVAVTFEMLWLQSRIVEEHGCGVQGNWGTMERTFLAYLAAILPSATQRELWIEKAVECLHKTVLGPCSPDGGYPEPPGYAHWPMLKGLELMELLTRCGSLGDTAADCDTRLRQMMEYQWRLMNPDDLLPEIGDGWYIFRGDIYMRFARRYQMKELTAACLRHNWKPTGDDLLFSGSVPDCAGIHVSERQSDLLPHDGYALFRAKGVQLTLFFGYQSGHGHFDTLSFQLFAHGRMFVAENVVKAKTLGCGYGSRFNEEWTCASRSHSMVLVDDRSYTEQKPGECVRWEQAGGVFRAPAYPDVIVSREIKQDGQRFTFVDQIEGGKKLGHYHTWRTFFPHDVDLTLNGRVALAKSAEGSVRFDFRELDDDAEIILETAPPSDAPPMEEIVQRGKMLLLRRPIPDDGISRFRWTLQTHE